MTDQERATFAHMTEATPEDMALFYTIQEHNISAFPARLLSMLALLADKHDGSPIDSYGSRPLSPMRMTPMTRLFLSRCSTILVSWSPSRTTPRYQPPFSSPTSPRARIGWSNIMLCSSDITTAKPPARITTRVRSSRTSRTTKPVSTSVKSTTNVRV